MSIVDWPVYWDELRSACKQRNATGRWKEGRNSPPCFEINPPATDQEVDSIEKLIEQSLPRSLRKVLTNYSRAVCIEWQIPKEELTAIPQELRGIWAGECRWNLEAIPSLLERYREWLDVFTDPNDKYDGPWQNKFPVLEVGNGDMIAIDIAKDHEQPVVYLSHEGDDTLHGFWLGSNYEDYIDRLAALGCVGAEDWQMKLFVSGPQSCLESNGENAGLWRKWFGLRLNT